MKGRGSAPAAPDPTATAAAQAKVNRVNLFSPMGNQLFGKMVANARPAGMTDEQWAAAPWDQRYRFEMEPDQASMQVQETPGQTQFRTGAEALANSMVGRARTQLDNLPVSSNINLPQLATGSGRVRRVMDDGLVTSVDGGPLRDQIDRSRIGADYVRGVDLSALGDYTTAVNRRGLQALPSIDDFGIDTARHQTAAFARAMNLMRPSMELERSRLVQTLADRGIPIGSEAYKAAIDQLDRSQGERLENAAYTAVGAGSAEQSRLAQLGAALRGQGFQENLTDTNLANQARAARSGESFQNVGIANQVRGTEFGEAMTETDLFNRVQDQRFAQAVANAQLANAAQQQKFAQAMGAAGLGNQAQQQMLANQLAQRQVNFNELAALMGGPQVGAPPIMSPANIDVVGPQNTAYSGQLAAYNARNQAANAGLGALAGLGAAGIMAYSSKDLKHRKGIPDPGVMLEAIEGLPIERWSYREETGLDQADHVGPMAEDVRDRMGIGDGTRIPLADLTYANLAATKEIARRLKTLEGRKTGPAAYEA
ncbi:MAG: tail fiber domain-containing protein [Planctomycetes bacterium]|nr:tail fiber domain-containing protein [Planctomycetota bacterium]